MLLRSLGLFTTLHVATLLRSLVSFTTLHTCCYAAEISGIVYYVTYMLLRYWDLWYRLLRYIHVATLLRSLVSSTTLHTCCYAAEISGIVYYVTCCYAAEISGIVYYVTCRYAAEISGIVYYVTYMLLRCWDLWDLWELGNGDAFTRMLTASCLLRMRCSDDAEKRKNAPQVFPGFPIIKLARHCRKITIFLKNVRFMGTVSGPAGCFCIETAKKLVYSRFWTNPRMVDCLQPRVMPHATRITECMNGWIRGGTSSSFS